MRKRFTDYTTVTPVWKGETCYIVCGGPSFDSLNPELLRGKRVIVINSSYGKVPWADYLIFADARWWRKHQERIRNCFQGKVVAVSSQAEGKPGELLRLRRRVPPPHLSDKPDEAIVQLTTTQAAINFAMHLGAARLVLVALDMQRGAPTKAEPQGATHHHEPHEWENKPGNGSWNRQLPALKATAGILRSKGIEVVVVSPTTRIDWWPVVSRLEDAT